MKDAGARQGGNSEGIKVAAEPSGVRVEVPVPGGHAYDYRVEFGKRKEMILTIIPLPLNGKVIALDPGHGGIDAGIAAGDAEESTWMWLYG